MTFSEAVAYEISRWENWKWAISTLLTIGSIFGAAYWAQGIFNKNARIRENRERRLKSLDELMKMYLIINKLVWEIFHGNSEERKSALAIIFDRTVDFNLISNFYFPEFTNNITLLTEEIREKPKDYLAMIQSCTKNEGENLKRVSIVEVLGQDSDSKIINILDDILEQLTITHKSIESSFE